MTLALAAVIAALPEQPSLYALLQFVGVGLVVVVSALSCLAVMCTFVGWLLKTIEQQKAEPKLAAPVPEEGVSEETLVLIASAVSAVVTQPHRIVHVRALTPDDLAWALQGRSQIHGSHVLNPQARR